jgi:hypothetical protein
MSWVTVVCNGVTDAARPGTTSLVRDAVKLGGRLWMVNMINGSTEFLSCD